MILLIFHIFFIIIGYSESEKERYAIYSIALNQVLEIDKKNHAEPMNVKIQKVSSTELEFNFDKKEFKQEPSNTFWGFHDNSETNPVFFILKDTTWFELLEKFNVIQTEKVNFENKFTNNIPIKLWKGRKSVKHIDSFWKRFYRKNPNTLGYVILSKIAFSLDEKKSILYYSVHRNGLNAVGGLLFFEKKDAIWIIKSNYELWMA